MTPVAVMYESLTHYLGSGWEGWGGEGDPPTSSAPVSVFEVFADGSRTFRGVGSYDWTPYGKNPYGYDGVTPITPEGVDMPRGTGAPACILGFSSTSYKTAIYASQDDADNGVNPTEIIHTQTVSGNSWEVKWNVRALMGGLAPALFWTSFVGATEKVA